MIRKYAFHSETQLTGYQPWSVYGIGTDYRPVKMSTVICAGVNILQRYKT